MTVQGDSMAADGLSETGAMAPARGWTLPRSLPRTLPQDWPVQALELALLAGLAFAVARLGWALVTPVGPLGDWQPAAPSAPVDRSVLGSFDPFFRSATDTGAAEVSDLSLTLLGTRVDTVSGRGSAIIAAADGVQSSFLVGEEVMPGVRLQAVAFDSVTLDRGGRSEQLFLDQSSGPGSPPASIAPAAPMAGPMMAAPASAGAQQALPAPRLAADIQATPRMRGTELSGFVLQPKGSGRAFAAAGLEPGDVLLRVDGIAVSAVGDPATAIRQLESKGGNLIIDRGGTMLMVDVKPNKSAAGPN